jgi:hypothetical protein
MKPEGSAVGNGEHDDAGLSWPRAAAIAVVTLVVGIGLLVFLTNVIVTKVTGVDRHVRVGLASAWFLLALAGLAWTLRRLQARHVV